ncbi:hypothetical protein [Thioalkalivibrio sp. ARh3]|uniref:hypothetical protein n=1 Tax=Thioalkalivibrio sp. ARh3 TaxID=1158148 RepID=UPI0003637F34|nr:hypothetical protein [Thioalkalivibrio sp. ARh3]
MKDEFESAWDEDDDTQTTAPEADAEDTQETDEAELEGQDDRGEAEDKANADEPGEEAGEDESGEAADEQEGEQGEGEGEEPDPDELKRRLEAAEQKMKSWDGRLSKEARERARLERENQELRQRLQQGATAPGTDSGQAASGDAAQSPGGVSPEQDTDTESDEELKRFREEFGDDLATFVEKRARQIAAEQAQQAQSSLEQRLTPLEQAQKEAADLQHQQAILAEHPDASEIAASNEFLDWIDSQPDYLQPAMRQVVQNGSAAQVNQLLSQYKTANPAKPAPSNERQRQKAQNARAVPSRSSAPPRRKADDFESAWDEF